MIKKIFPALFFNVMAVFAFITVHNDGSLAATSDRYFISGDPATTSAWSLESGGETGASVPAESTDVFIDYSNNAFTATANISCKTITVTSGYSGNITFAGYTIRTKYGIVNNGTGTMNWGNGLNIDSAGALLTIGAGVGTQTVSSCPIVITTSATFTLDKFVNAWKLLELKNNTQLISGGIHAIWTNNAGVPLVVGDGCKITCNSGMVLRRSTAGAFFTFGVNDTIAGTGGWTFYPAANSVTTMPAFTTTQNSAYVSFDGTTANNVVTFTGNIDVSSASTLNFVYSTAGITSIVNLAGYDFSSKILRILTTSATANLTINLGSGTGIITSFNGWQNNIGTTTITRGNGTTNCSGDWRNGSTCILKDTGTINFNGATATTFTTERKQHNNIVLNKTANGLTINGVLLCYNLDLEDGTFVQTAATDTVYTANVIVNTSDAVTNIAPWNVSNKMTIKAGLTLTLPGLIIGGTAGALDTLRSGTLGSKWYLNLVGNQTIGPISYMNISDLDLDPTDTIIVNDGTSVLSNNSPNVRGPTLPSGVGIPLRLRGNSMCTSENLKLSP